MLPTRSCRKPDSPKQETIHSTMLSNETTSLTTATSDTAAAAAAAASRKRHAIQTSRPRKRVKTEETEPATNVNDDVSSSSSSPSPLPSSFLSTVHDVIVATAFKSASSNVAPLVTPEAALSSTDPTTVEEPKGEVAATNPSKKKTPTASAVFWDSEDDSVVVEWEGEGADIITSNAATSESSSDGSVTILSPVKVLSYQPKREQVGSATSGSSTSNLCSSDDVEKENMDVSPDIKKELSRTKSSSSLPLGSRVKKKPAQAVYSSRGAAEEMSLVKENSKFRPTINLADLSDSEEDDADFLELLDTRSPFAVKTDLKRETELRKFGINAAESESSSDESVTILSPVKVLSYQPKREQVGSATSGGSTSNLCSSDDVEKENMDVSPDIKKELPPTSSSSIHPLGARVKKKPAQVVYSSRGAAEEMSLVKENSKFRPMINLADLSDSEEDDANFMELLDTRSPFAAKMDLKRETELRKCGSNAATSESSSDESVTILSPVKVLSYQPKREQVGSSTSSSFSSNLCSSDDVEKENMDVSPDIKEELSPTSSSSIRPLGSRVKKKPAQAVYSSRGTVEETTLVKAESKFRPMINLADLSDSEEDDADFLEMFDTRSPFAAKTDLKRETELRKFDSNADKALQTLLWKLKFGDTLHIYQTMAVRRVAGLPPDFPLHRGSGIITATTRAVAMTLAVLGLPKVAATRGVLLADEMGLGKTIESIAGMILYNGIEEYRTRKQRPSVVITPNKAVLEQWVEALTRNGVHKGRIFRFKKGMRIHHTRNDFILMEKSKLQSEMKAIFDGITKKTFTPKTSSLFPHITMDQYCVLRTQYRASQGKCKNGHRSRGEKTDDCVRRLVDGMAKGLKNKEACFRTIVIDESHFLKNQLAYWGISALLLTIHSERSIPMSGTPYNNGTQDLAAAMGYIDVGLESARNAFWKKALLGTSEKSVQYALKEWNADYLIRRTKDVALKGLLGEKTIKREVVLQHPDEMFLQEHYEGTIARILQDFSKSLDSGNSPYAVARQKQQYTILMAIISSARMAVFHPLLPGGRELTKAFSPSRRHLIANEEKKDVCVYCNPSLRPTVPLVKPCDQEDDEQKQAARQERRSRLRAHIDLDLDDENINDDDVGEDVEREEKEELVPLPDDICPQGCSQARHFVHEKCLEIMQMHGDQCPRCIDAGRRLHIRGIGVSESKFVSTVYCQHIEAIPGQSGGFTGSSKINRIVEHVRDNIPKEDKVLILSFFKGSLDLLEGILEEDMDIRCSRFDGDLGPEKANEDLEAFKKKAEKKVLLATVQSGGTGLNIVEANHVIFVDRHFNPFTHAQAMDRCYRLGQKKDVHVSFFDGAGSIDEVMQMLNQYKSQNSKVILADGTELGANAGGNLSYNEVSGLLSRALSGITGHRADHIQQNGRGALLQATRGDLMDAILNNTMGEYQATTRHLRAQAAVDTSTASGDATVAGVASAATSGLLEKLGSLFKGLTR